MTLIPENEQNVIVARIQQGLVESGVLNLQLLAVDADDLISRVEDYQQKAQAKYGNPYGNRTPEQIALWIVDDIFYDYGQSDAGM